MVTHSDTYSKGDSAEASATRAQCAQSDYQGAEYLKGRVRCGPAFANAMLVLGRIVMMEARSMEGNPCKFNDWPYVHHMRRWIHRDLMVHVMDDATFFEGFAQNESVYGRVRLAHESMELSHSIKPGRTKITFNDPLKRAFSRIRSYRPLDVTLGAHSIQIGTEASAVIEHDLHLPTSWSRSFIQVQSALMLSSMVFQLSPAFVAEMAACLSAKREKYGPRAMTIRLFPYEPVSVEIEPGGRVLVDHTSQYTGSCPEEIRIWGGRQLLILKDILPDAVSVDVRLLGSGMPSFWTVHVDEVQLTVGLSGWTAMDWAHRARFRSLMFDSNLVELLLSNADNLLRSSGRMSPSQLAGIANVSEVEARDALQKLCLTGSALFDPNTTSFRWRVLNRMRDELKYWNPEEEERMGISLHDSGNVSINRILFEDGRQTIEVSDVYSNHGEHTLLTVLNERVTDAECSCMYFIKNNLRLGPCRHLVALSMIAEVGRDRK